MINYKSPVQIRWNEASEEILNESKKIIQNIVILNQIPDRLYRILIDGYVEIEQHEEIISETQFKCNYQTGILTFHPSQEGNTININRYFGKGIILYPSCRVALQDEDNYYSIKDVESAFKEIYERVDNIITGVEQPSEIVDARQSAVKGETFETLKARLEDIESDAESHKAENMPHLMQVNNKIYQYGFKQENGFVKFIYKEVE